MKRFKDYIFENKLIFKKPAPQPEPILEGGNAIKIARGIRQDEVNATLEDIKKNLFKKYFKLDEEMYCLLGSAGKKAKPEDLSGDLDMGIFIPPLAVYFNCEMDKASIINNLTNFFKKHFPKLELYPSVGLGLISVGWPIKSDQGGYVQLDLMLSDNIEWTKFAWHSPDLGKLESKYKGAYRNAILQAICDAGVYEVVTQPEDTDKIKKGEKIQIDKQNFDRLRGLTRVVKSFVGKKGAIIKTPVTISRAIETNVPEDFCKIVLGPDFSTKDANSFESLLAVTNSKNFRHFKKKDEIIENTKRILQEINMPLPEELI